MTHSQQESLAPAAQAALSSPVSPEGSVFQTIFASDSPVPFETIVEQVQSRRGFTRATIAASLAALINKRRVFLNQERSGFVAVRRETFGRAQRKASRLA